MVEIKTNTDSNTARFLRSVITNYIYILNSNVDRSVENEIRTVLSEMISNVLVHAYPENEYYKPITVTIDHREEDSKLVLVMTVEDDGVGMSDVNKCKTPMYTTTKDESRCGLGFTIMETMSDKLLITSNPGSGTRVLVEKYLTLDTDATE
jgi:stage II sporulation protein AB (anti-sigma F factor)